MKFSKMTMIGVAISFLSLSCLSNAAEKNDTDEKRAAIMATIDEFNGLEKCDGSQRAQNVCAKNCTGEGYLWGKGTCSHPEIWEKCSEHCRADLIKGCVDTATNKKNNLKNTAQCK